MNALGLNFHKITHLAYNDEVMVTLSDANFDFITKTPIFFFKLKIIQNI